MGYTPMIKQYKEIKEQNKDCILFFRLGDFYEMFFEDALLASKELEIVLTQRDYRCSYCWKSSSWNANFGHRKCRRYISSSY